ncbi:unnamed protein product [Boreogadus saida]
MFLRAVLLCGLYALALAGPLTEPSSDFSVGELERGSYPPTDSPTDSNVTLERGSYLLSNSTPSTDSNVTLESSSHLVKMALSDSGSCEHFWVSFGVDCYKYVASKMNWIDAEKNCISLGGHLVSIHSTGENNFIVMMVESFDPLKGPHWIGFFDVIEEGTWMWIDGSPNDFTSWRPNEPNNVGGNEDCVAFDSTQPGWNDWRCSEAAASVCKAGKTC